MTNPDPVSEPGPIRVWLLPVTERPPASWRGCLDNHECARADRFVRDADRDHFVAAHTLLRVLLSHIGDRPAPAWQFAHTAQGQPYIVGDSASAHLRFSLTHTSGLVAAALAPDGHDVGIDAETLDRPLHPRFAKRVLTPDELAELEHLDGPAAQPAILQRWVLKEALAKAAGRGLALPFHRIGFPTTAPPRPVFGTDLGLGGAEHWHLLSWATAGHHLAIAVHRGERAAPPCVVESLQPARIDRLLEQAND